MTARNHTRCRAAAEHRSMPATAIPAIASTKALFMAASSTIGSITEVMDNGSICEAGFMGDRISISGSTGPARLGMECADLSALWEGGTCHAEPGDESPERKAATSRRTPNASRGRASGIVRHRFPKFIHRESSFRFARLMSEERRRNSCGGIAAAGSARWAATAFSREPSKNVWRTRWNADWPALSRRRTGR